MEIAHKEMLEANQANSRLREELDTTKVLNVELQETVKRLTSEMREAQKNQAEVVESFSRCKDDLSWSKEDL